MPFSKIAFSKAVKGIRKRATGFFLLAILFLVVGSLQDAFVNYQTHKTTTLELNESADEIASEIYKGDKWDMESYRQAFFSVSSWYVFTVDGTLIDNEVPIPGFLKLFHTAELQTNLTFGTPQTITSEVGGKYRLLSQKIHRGIVVVCLDIEESTNNQCFECLDEKLAQNLAQFGSTIERAVAVTSREVNQDISYVVIDDSGQLQSGLGEVPLKIDPTLLYNAAESNRPLRIDNRLYTLITKPILNSKGRIMGTIVVPSDVTLQRRAMDDQWKFNLTLSALAFAIAFLIVVYFIGRELVRSPNFENLPEALQTPENLNKEFKSSFQWDIGRNCRNLDERIKPIFPK